MVLEMFAKIFGQIFDSSIADNHKHRHVFMDLLVLADSDGVVDMTVEAVARRTNVPLDEVIEAIDAFCAPDIRSNSRQEEGRRLLPIDERKPWGWQIVNYHHYRAIRDEEARRTYMREYRRAEREKKRPKKAKGPKPKIAKRTEPMTSTLYPVPPPERESEAKEAF
jgi:hypothetical protein